MSAVISVKEARKILGSVAQDMSDDEIDKVVDDLDALARAFIQSYIRGEMKLPADAGTQTASPKIK